MKMRMKMKQKQKQEKKQGYIPQFVPFAYPMPLGRLQQSHNDLQSTIA